MNKLTALKRSVDSASPTRTAADALAELAAKLRADAARAAEAYVARSDTGQCGE